MTIQYYHFTRVWDDDGEPLHGKTRGEYGAVIRGFHRGPDGIARVSDADFINVVELLDDYIEQFDHHPEEECPGPEACEHYSPYEYYNFYPEEG